MNILVDNNNSMGANSYLVYDNKNLDAYIIDAPSKSLIFDKVIDENKLNLKYVILTHGHFDHIYGVNYWRENYGALVVAHCEEKELMNNSDLNLSSLFGSPITVVADIYLEKDGRFEIFEYLHTPGHTSGGMTLKLDDVIFTGDTLFKGSIGRTDFPTGDYGRLISSIKVKLGRLKSDVVVYPGHGERTSLGLELKNNPFLL